MYHTMKETCQITGLSYETLKFYCKSGLVPNVRRDSANRRVFDDRCIAWIEGLNCLRGCGMGIDEMKAYMQLCLEGQSSIPRRKEILADKRDILVKRLNAIQDSIAYIDAKQRFYDGVLSGAVRYRSNLIDVDDNGDPTADATAWPAKAYEPTCPACPASPMDNAAEGLENQQG